MYQRIEDFRKKRKRKKKRRKNCHFWNGSRTFYRKNCRNCASLAGSLQSYMISVVFFTIKSTKHFEALREKEPLFRVKF